LVISRYIGPLPALTSIAPPSDTRDILARSTSSGSYFSMNLSPLEFTKCPLRPTNILSPAISKNIAVVWERSPPISKLPNSAPALYAIAHASPVWNLWHANLPLKPQPPAASTVAFALKTLNSPVLTSKPTPPATRLSVPFSIKKVALNVGSSFLNETASNNSGYTKILSGNNTIDGSFIVFLLSSVYIVGKNL